MERERAQIIYALVIRGQKVALSRFSQGVWGLRPIEDPKQS